MRRGGLLALGAVALVLAGCGGARLTQAQFEAKTKAICAGYTKRAERELASLSVPPPSRSSSSVDVARFGRLLEHVATLFGRQLDDLREVRPPRESAGRYREVLRLYGQLENALGRAARAVRKGDLPGLARIEGELEPLAAQADSLGFRCD